MSLNRFFIITTFFLACHMVPSQQLPALSALTQPMIRAGIPFSGLLDPTLSMKVIENLTDLSKSISRGDFLFSGMKTMEVLRAVLKVVNLKELNGVDNFLEMLHGVLESIHPFMKSLEENAEIIIAEETQTKDGSTFKELKNAKPTPIMLISNGFKLLTSIPKMLVGAE